MTSLDPFPPGTKMTGAHPNPSQWGVFHRQEHPIGQRGKTRARGQLWAGEDSKVNQET